MGSGRINGEEQVVSNADMTERCVSVDRSRDYRRR